MAEDDNKGSRITAGGIEILVHPSKVSREGFGQVYELFSKARDKNRSKRAFRIDLDVGFNHKEVHWRTIDFGVDNFPSMLDLNTFLRNRGLFLAQAKIDSTPEKIWFEYEDGVEIEAYCMGTADVYSLNKDRKNERMDGVRVPDSLPENIR